MTTTLEPTIVRGRPGYEGGNIRTWVGFKHFDYLVEAAVLQWLREHAVAPGRLYREHGVGVEIVDCSLLLPAVLDVDDEVTVEVRPVRPGRFGVRLAVHRDDTDVTVCRAKVTVALVRERDAPASDPLPPDLAGLVVDGVREAADLEPRDLDVPAGAEPADVFKDAFLWTWRVPYFYCHYSDRVQHSGYVRALEEVVDRFLADRGISVGRMLAERGWIPVVSRARVRLVADAHMEETMFTTFTVQEVLKGVTYDARMDCHVRRGDRLVHVATAQILHGYAVSRGPDAGRLAELDGSTLDALTGRAAR